MRAYGIYEARMARPAKKPFKSPRFESRKGAYFCLCLGHSVTSIKQIN